MLRTSGFVDDVMFSYHVENGPESKTTLYFKQVRQVAIPVGRRTSTVYCARYSLSECGAGGEVCHLRFLLC